MTASEHTELVAKLRHLVSLNDPKHGGPYGGHAAQECMAAMQAAADALAALPDGEEPATIEENATVGTKHSQDLMRAIAEAAINVANRPPELRGPYQFDEAELQDVAAAARKFLGKGPDGAEPVPVAWQGNGKGFVFLNPDTGDEYSKNHPIESGECEDAQDIRPSTAFEDAIIRQLTDQLAVNATLTEGLNSARADYQSAWNRAETAEAALASPTGMGDWQRAAMDETIRRITGMLTWGDVPLSRPDADLVEHIKGMPARMTADYSPAKIGRWLGWVQGVACAKGWLHLDDCKRINKEASAALHPTSETTEVGNG